MEKKELYLGEEELIVGERGRAPKRIPTFPEIASHSVEDLKALNSQNRIPYHVSPETMEIYEREVIPYWDGAALRDKMFDQLSDEWQTIYNCGLITETMEQRAPGSMGLDERMFALGLRAAKQEIAAAIENLDFFNDLDGNNCRRPCHDARGGGICGCVETTCYGKTEAASQQPSLTYNDFVNISLGGVTKDGRDAVNDLSYIFLEILDEIEFIQPQVHVLLSRMNPEHFLKEACRVIRKGRGFPAMFNAEAIIAQQLQRPCPMPGAAACGCVETTCYGKEAAPLIGYINIAKILELTLQNGYDRRMNKQVGPKTGDPGISKAIPHGETAGSLHHRYKDQRVPVPDPDVCKICAPAISVRAH